MKKNILLIFALVLSLSTLFAQKAKKFDVKFNYLRYADQPLPLWVKTYATKVKSSSGYVILGEAEENTLALQGFEESEKFEDADVQVKFTIDGIKLRSDIKEKTRTEEKDKKEYEVTEYYYSIVAKPVGNYKITLKNKQKVEAHFFSSDDFKYTLNSNMYSRKADAVRAYNKSKESLLMETAEAAVKRIISHLANNANMDYGYYYYNSWVKISTGKDKKSDYSDLNTLVDRFKQAVEHYDKKEYEEYNQIAVECVSSWEKALSEFKPNDKKASKKGRINKKIADRLNYNIAAAYLYMNEFDKAILFTEKGLVIDRSVAGKDLLSDIKILKKRYEKNQKREREQLAENK